VNQLKKLLNGIKNFYYWIKRYFTLRYTIHISYDSQWGNEDDQVYNGVRKIIKSNFKELKFRTEDKRTVHIRGMNGLRYRIEDE
tara:strand:+ start:5592 stop:5843 length:252 start_codon:yes stop_codon:yes gene_type:complete